MGILMLWSKSSSRFLQIACTLTHAWKLVMENDTNGTWQGEGKTIRLR